MDQDIENINSLMDSVDTTTLTGHLLQQNLYQSQIGAGLSTPFLSYNIVKF